MTWGQPIPSNCKDQFCMQCGLPAVKALENAGGYPAFFCFKHDLKSLARKNTPKRGRFSGQSERPYGGYDMF